MQFFRKEVDIIKNSKSDNIYNNLHNQIVKIDKHNRQGSFKTRERYFQGTDRFCKYIASEFGVQKFSNIQNKHIESYVKYQQENGLAASTIKTDLAGIRFYADKSDCQNNLMDNRNLELEKRSFGGVDRSWTKEEYSKFKEICYEKGNDRVRYITSLARNEGLRIHETLRLDRATAEKALRTDILHVKGKGGKEREVPLSNESKQMLMERIREVERGEKLFVSRDKKTHLVIKQVQNFINRNRDTFQNSHRTVNITFHGLRHTFAQERYKNALERGLSDYKARLEVSKLLGHERDDVTRIYLAK